MKKHIVIEIGSNSIKSLMATPQDESWQILSDKIYPARLGEGVSQSGLLSQPAMERNLDTILQIISSIPDINNSELHIIATASLRKVSNAEEFIRQVKDRFSLQVMIISGEEEAGLSYLAATQSGIETEKAYGVLDIGGGSTELALGRGGVVNWQKSLSIGAVTMTEQYIRHDPPADVEVKDMEKFIVKVISEFKPEQNVEQLIGVGGTVTTLARLSGYGLPDANRNVTDISAMKLPREEIKRLKQLLSTLTFTQKAASPKMPKGRADIILAGACILDEVMSYLEVNEVTVSVRGVRHGFLYSLSQ
jgi:exopolyphosphatase/guanosine-5'-triphosphate,3'-diphosphate pyrophosphatase